MRIAITGSNGFIGSELVRHFIGEGHEVWLLQRTKPVMLHPRAHHIHYDLNEVTLFEELPPVDALIHTAYMPFKKNNNASRKNIVGTILLYNYCLQKNIHFVYLSTLSAHEQALSVYGQHKFKVENLLETSRCLVLKLGLVMGKRGLFARIKKTLEKHPFIFLVGGGGQPVQPVAVEDVVKVIAESIQIKRKGLYMLASEKVYTLRELLRQVAQQLGVKPIFVPVPYWAADTGIKVIKSLHLPLPVSRENLLGLKQLRAFDTRADIKKLGIRLRNF